MGVDRHRRHASRTFPNGWWTPGLTAVAPVESGQPEWAELVEHVLDTVAPVAPVETAAPAELVDPLAPFVAYVRMRIADRLAGAGDLDPAGVADGFGAALLAQLGRISARTMVLELHRLRERGVLLGDTPTARFADFVVRQSRPDALAGVFGEYPVLARLVGQSCLRTLAAAGELADRFVRDRAALVAALCDDVDPGRLVTVRAEVADVHAGGRAVAILRFASGAQVVYKPRPVDLLVRFGAIAGWLTAVRPDLGPRTVRVVARDGYGWTGFVAAEPPRDERTVAAYYRRYGALLAVLHAVHGSDMHYENVLVAGDSPVLVDVETLFHPPVRIAASTGSDPAADRLFGSVARTALLPTLLVGEHGALDVSGVGGDDDAVLPHDEAVWADSGTDTMHLVRGPRRLRAAGNRPTLHGGDVDPLEHRAEIRAGFRDGYAAIVAQRAEFQALLRSCADCAIRVVVRPTAAYARLLDESTHPDVLRDAGDRDRLLARLDELAPHQHSAALVAAEIADLWAGDVPLFTTRPDRTDLVTSTGVVLAHELDRPGLDDALRTVAALGPADQAAQEWLIDAILATRRTGPDHHGDATVPAAAMAAGDASPDRLLAAAEAIGADLLARAVEADGRVNWLGLEPVGDQSWQVLPLGGSLATGYPGVALFLAELGAQLGERRWLAAAAAAVGPLGPLLTALAADPETAAAVGCGGYAGLGGIAYATARLDGLLPDIGLGGVTAAAVRAAEVALAAGRPEDQPGVAGGHAGGAAAFAAVHAMSALPAARVLADRLAAAAELPVRPGFLDGVEGARWALARAGRSVPAAADTGPPVGAGWCRGAAGILAAAPVVPPWGPDWVGRMAAGRTLADHSLCHGELGVWEGLAAVAGGGAALATRAAALLDRLDQDGPRCGTPDAVASPGLLTGLAGIGYGLLRLARPDVVPSVLLLEPTAQSRTPVNGAGTAAGSTASTSSRA